MTGEVMPQAMFYLLALVLPIAAVVGRRVPLGRVLGTLAIWVAIFAGGLYLLGQRARIEPYLAHVASLLSLDDQQVSGKEVRIRMPADGHFWARATIDGVSRRLLVDSGATMTALSSATAAAAKLDVVRPAFPVILRTANGDISARTASIGTLRLGDIVAGDLPVVVSPAFGDTDVLGMNFLSRLKSWRVEGRTLILTPHRPKNFT